MNITIMPDGEVIVLDGNGTLAEELGEARQERASHVQRDDRLVRPWAGGKPVLAARSSEEGQWTVRLSFSPINGRMAGYQLPNRFASRREAIAAEVKFIERNIL